MNLETYLQEKRTLVDQGLKDYLNIELNKKEGPFLKLYSAMEYALFPGGKRLRPILTLATCEVCGGKTEEALPAALAIELIHNYSLIHDDLPSMDNDDFRRGRLSLHKKFSESTAILVGDALLTDAFRLLSSLKERISAEIVVSIIENLSKACGSIGMVGGQFLDISITNKKALPYPEIEFINIHKTGGLILTSIISGAKIARASKTNLSSLTKYGENIGLAFQITDDIIDFKEKSKDKTQTEGLSFPYIISLDEAQERVKELEEKAIESLKPLGEKAKILKEIAHYLTERIK